MGFPSSPNLFSCQEPDGDINNSGNSKLCFKESSAYGIMFGEARLTDDHRIQPRTHGTRLFC